jgi:hypothetical protein
MPTRKQRRRQQKERRHEWEYVYVDDEGNEVDVDPDDVEHQKVARAARKDATARRNGKAPATRQTPRRAPQPPSWRRAIKRAAILGVFFVVVFGFVLRGKNSNLAAAVGVGLIYAVAFVPMQYLIDRFTYRVYLRRQGQGASPKPR